MDEASIRNDLVGLAQRRETANYIESVKHILRNHSNDVVLLDNLHVLHITVWLTETGDALWKELLRIGCSPFACDFNGDTTLHYAIRSSNLAYLQHLHSKIGDRILNVVNHQLCNLMITCCAETPDEPSTDVLLCLEWLYLNGMTLEAQDSQGKTALMWAAQRNSLTICHWLMSRGAHLAHRDHMNRTALHVASSSGNYDVVLFLCEQGGIKMVNAESHDDRRINTPIRIAWQRGHLWLAISLLSWKLCDVASGRCTFLNSPYAWVAFVLIVWNFACGQWIFLTMRRPLPELIEKNWMLFAILMVVTFTSWFLAAKNDAGAVRPREKVLPNQSQGCSVIVERDIRVFEKTGKQQSALSTLRALEAQGKRISGKMATLNRECHGVIRRDQKAKIEQMLNALEALNDQMNTLRPDIARERQRQQNCPYYVKRVLSPFGPPTIPPPPMPLAVSGICLTCHHIKTIRQHHCSDCGVCVHRFDHHCVWIDNCVGIKNQAFFLLFLFSLSLSLVYYDVISALYIEHTVFGESSVVSDFDVSKNLLQLLFTPIFYFSLINVITNILWLCFCSYLLFRTTRSMLTDVTFYETMKKSPYVERRFALKGGYAAARPFWDFKGLTCTDAVQNAAHFLIQSSARDAVNYKTNVATQPLLV